MANTTEWGEERKKAIEELIDKLADVCLQFAKTCPLNEKFQEEHTEKEMAEFIHGWSRSGLGLGVNVLIDKYNMKQEILELVLDRVEPQESGEKRKIVRADLCQFCDNFDYCEERGLKCEAYKRIEGEE